MNIVRPKSVYGIVAGPGKDPIQYHEEYERTRPQQSAGTNKYGYL